MRPVDFLTELQERGLLTPPQAAALADYEHRRPFSLHYEIRTLLYLGITLLSGGLGVLLYQHLDDIGHATVVVLITLLTAACFAYAARHRPPFTWGQAPIAQLLPDYLLLLGCLLFLALEGYVQAEYGLFGTRYGLALLVPAVLFFYLAYRFDHRGVLSMAITALAAWAGLSVAPLSVFKNEFLTAPVSRAALGLGVALMVVGWLSETRRRKPHFTYTYILLGSNLLLAAATAALLNEVLRPAMLLLLLILGVSGFLFWYGRRTHSYLFLLLGVGYGYFAATYGLVLLFEAVDRPTWQLVEMFFTLYVMASVAGTVWFIVNIQKIVGKDDRQSL